MVVGCDSELILIAFGQILHFKIGALDIPPVTPEMDRDRVRPRPGQLSFFTLDLIKYNVKYNCVTNYM